MNTTLSDGSILTFNYEVNGGNISVDASKPACGMSFSGVAKILDPLGQVPALQIETGLGLEAVEAIVSFAKQFNQGAIA